MSSSRISSLASALERNGIDAYFAQDPISMGYLHGFCESGHERFLTLGVSKNGEIQMICPALSESQVRRAGIEIVATWTDADDPLKLFEALSERWDLESGIIAVDGSMPARMLLQMQSVLPAALFQSGENVLGSLMSVKDSSEIELMRRAGTIADETYETVFPKIRAGLTEVQVETLLRDEMLSRGGKPEFAIVASGPNSAEPHHLTDSTPIDEGDVLILDFGCTVEGYSSDITRTVAVGFAPARAQEVYEVVFKAHMAGRLAIHAGASGAEVDAAARKVITDAGFGPHFVHRTGHGIGMNGHETPFIVSSNETPLVPGNCFSIEPGIYLPLEFGVRIENIVTCTAGGHESLNAEPPSSIPVCG